MLTCANVGDSRVILGAVDGSGNLKVEEVSHDHKPDNPDEQKRIEASGGRVFGVRYPDGVVGPARVWLAKKYAPGLAMSRSLGDTVAHSVGVSSTPEIVRGDSCSRFCVLIPGKSMLQSGHEDYRATAQIPRDGIGRSLGIHQE